MGVTVYSMTHCAGCKAVKRLLTDCGVAYEEHLVDQEPEALEFLRKRNISSVPYTVIGNLEIQGVRPEQIRMALQSVGLIGETAE